MAFLVEIVVERYEEQKLRTFGRMYIDGELICDTLEDTDRHLEDRLPDIEALRKDKVYAQTAIPRGTYNAELYWWAKHRNWYPWVKNVPGYTGILIHGGATENNTSGCILVGTRQGDIIVKSSEKMKIIREKMKGKSAKITVK